MSFTFKPVSGFLFFGAVGCRLSIASGFHRPLLVPYCKLYQRLIYKLVICIIRTLPCYGKCFNKATNAMAVLNQSRLFPENINATQNQFPC